MINACRAVLEGQGDSSSGWLPKYRHLRVEAAGAELLGEQLQGHLVGVAASGGILHVGCLGQQRRLVLR